MALSSSISLRIFCLAIVTFSTSRKGCWCFHCNCIFVYLFFQFYRVCFRCFANLVFAHDFVLMDWLWKTALLKYRQELCPMGWQAKTASGTAGTKGSANFTWQITHWTPLNIAIFWLKLQCVSFWKSPRSPMLPVDMIILKCSQPQYSQLKLLKMSF